MIIISVQVGMPIFVLESEFYQHVRSKIELNLEQLPYDVCLGSEDIYGTEDWAELDSETRRKIGRYIAIMAKSDDIPFSAVPQKHEYPKRYVRV